MNQRESFCRLTHTHGCGRFLRLLLAVLYLLAGVVHVFVCLCGCFLTLDCPAMVSSPGQTSDVESFSLLLESGRDDED